MAATLDLGALGFSLTLDKSGWNKSWNEADKDMADNSSKLKNFAGGMPCWNRFCTRHLIFSLMDRLSSWANDARIVSINSPSPLMV